MFKASLFPAPAGAVMSSLFLLPFLFLAPASMLEFRYHNNREIEQYLLQVNVSNPDITHLYSIGESVQGDDTPV